MAAGLARQARADQAARPDAEQEDRQHHGEGVGGGAEDEDETARERDLGEEAQESGDGIEQDRASCAALTGHGRLGDGALGCGQQHRGQTGAAGEHSRGPHGARKAESRQQDEPCRERAHDRAESVERVEQADRASALLRRRRECGRRSGQRSAHQDGGNCEQQHRESEARGAFQQGGVSERSVQDNEAAFRRIQQERAQERAEPDAQLQQTVEPQRPGDAISDASQPERTRGHAADDGREDGAHREGSAPGDLGRAPKPGDLENQRGGPREEQE